MLALAGAESFVGDDLGQQGRGFLAARAPDDIASGRGVPFVADLGQPGIEEPVPLAVGADAEGFEVPAILAVMLQGQLRPELRGLGGGVVPKRQGTFAADLG